MKNTLHTSNKQRSQRGFVAILSVIFFTLLALVITVGFIRITITEQEQALNNDLTARALAAAEAGVEDAKRAITYYAQLPDGSVEKQNFFTAFDSGDCESLYGASSPIGGVLGLDPNGQVASASDQNLYYTCLTVNLDTPSFLDTVAAGESTVIPLRSDDNFNRVKLEWHLVSDAAGADGDGGMSDFYPNPRDLPTLDEFSNDYGSNEPPAYLRVQLIGVPESGNFTRDDMENRSYTAFLMPSDSGSPQFSISDNDPRGFGETKSSPELVGCDRNAASGQYACEIDIVLPGGALRPDNNRYFLQVTSIYRDAHIRAQLLQNSTPRMFNEVQPLITSTGRATDTLRQVIARVSMPGAQNEMLRYVAQVGTNICKQFQVTNDPADFAPAAAGVPGCDTPPPPPPPPTCTGGQNDVMLVLDNSESMKFIVGSKTAMQHIKEVSTNFIQNSGVAASGNRIGIVTFNSLEPELAHLLSFNQPTLIDEIEAMEPFAGTSYTPAMRLAADELNSPRDRGGKPNIMVFMSDGAPKDDPEGKDGIRDLADAIKGDGVIIYTIGLIGGRTFEDGNEFDEGLLIDMASGSQNYAGVNSRADIERVFEEISADLDCK